MAPEGEKTYSLYLALSAIYSICYLEHRLKMHFLCLHGMGTNSQVFEMQTGRYDTFPVKLLACGTAHNDLLFI